MSYKHLSNDRVQRQTIHEDKSTQLVYLIQGESRLT